MTKGERKRETAKGNPHTGDALRPFTDSVFCKFTRENETY